MDRSEIRDGEGELLLLDQDHQHENNADGRHQVLRIGDREESICDWKIEAADEKSDQQYFEEFEHMWNFRQ